MRGWDAAFQCQDCGEEFIFTASVQRFWYEDLQFYVDSEPKRCTACRKAGRTRLELRKRYNALIADALSSSTLEAKKVVLEIIDELESCGASLPQIMRANRAALSAHVKKPHD